jgi:hypothetical protein
MSVRVCELDIEIDVLQLLNWNSNFFNSVRSGIKLFLTEIYMEEDYYQINSDGNTFLARVIYEEKLQSDYGRIRIYFGGSIKCISVMIMEDRIYGDLAGVRYNRKCIIEETLKRSSGTENMVKSAIKFATYICPTLKVVRLIDDSKIKCRGNVEIPLNTLYIAKYGKTWYMEKFNAVFDDKNFKTKLEKVNYILDNTEMISFEKFYKKYIHKFLYRFEVERDNIKVDYRNLETLLKDAYIRSNHYREFIKIVDEENDCSIFFVWLNKFVTNLMNMNFQDVGFSIKTKNCMEWNQPPITKLKHKPLQMVYGGRCQVKSKIFPKFNFTKRT